MCGLASSELCTTFAYEFNADHSALASDGQHWRSVFGGARLVGPLGRCPPPIFLLFRALLFAATAAVCVLQLQHSDSVGYTYFLYFENWTMVAQMTYFGLATLLTLVGVCMTDSSGAVSRTTPFLVRVTELCYSVLLPATITNFLCSFGILYSHPLCVSLVDSTQWVSSGKAPALAGAMLAIVLLDMIFNRQPYYSSFHGLGGILFVWAYFIFATVFEFAGGTDAWGHTYIYRCLDWSFPWTGGGSYSAGKALYIIFFTLVPVLNYLFWLLLWTRRRALVSRKGDKGRSVGSATITLLANRVTPAPRMFFEYAADYRDLALDGRHWRAQFGGSSGRGPKMGAYVLCSPVLYTLFRLLLCMGSVRAHAHASLLRRMHLLRVACGVPPRASPLVRPTLSPRRPTLSPRPVALPRRPAPSPRPVALTCDSWAPS